MRPIFLDQEQENPSIMIEGRKRERAKAERPSEAMSRYYKMLKKRKEEEKARPKPEEKAPEESRPSILLSMKIIP